ncbi:gliding motility-associated C-terminal domain-containing protein [Ulvibacter antarcticus]|nr:gliding motility-associated C-terminal domain-containing protein [Ulvibacter antarcticus]
MYLFTKFISSEKIQIFICVFLLAIFGSSYAQTINTTTPAGGFEIDGNLGSNTPTNGVGDWVEGVAGTGGFVLTSTGDGVNVSTSALKRDQFNSPGDNIFAAGLTSNDNPGTWIWTTGSIPGKLDIGNTMYHITKDGSNNEWIFVSGDRRLANGVSYLDFEFLQNTLTLTPTFGFTSAGPDNGRTVNDILMTVEYGTGGNVATIDVYQWEDIGGGNFEYVLQAVAPANAVAKTNDVNVAVPFGAFGVFNYTPERFVEAGLNITSILGTLPDPCVGVSFKTLFVRSKEASLPTTSLKDFRVPIQLGPILATAKISYVPNVVCNDSAPIQVTQTGVSGGVYSAVPAGLDIDPATGEINVQNSVPGVFTITYTYGNIACLQTTTTTFTILANPDAPISGGDQSECAEDPIQTLTATATVPAGQTIVWYDAPAGGNVVANPTLNTVGTITYYAEAVINSSNCKSTSRTSVTLTIIASPNAPISGGNQTECEENPIQTLTATATVPAGQTITWYDAPTGGNVVANPILNTVGTITYYAEATLIAGGCQSTTRTAVILTITAAPNAPLSGGDQTECAQDPIQTLTATATVPGGQTIVWYDAATGGNVVANPILNTIGTVTYYAEAVITVGGCTSSTRTAVTLTITASPAAPISGGDQTECAENPIQTLTATATVPGGQTIVWYDAAIGGNVVANPILNAVGTVTYYAEASITATACLSLTRTAVILTILNTPAAPISGGDQTECAQDPIQTLTATATVPGGQTIVWYDAATGGNVVANPILNTIGTITYYAEAVITVGGCTSSTRTAVTLTITASPAAPISGGDQTECAENPIQTLTATATVPAGQTIVWYDAAIGGNVVANPILNAVGTVTYYAEASITATACLSLTRTAVTLTILNTPAAPISGGDQTECEEDPIQTLTATATVPGGQTIVWYDAATGGNVVANPILNTIGTITYYAEAVITVGGCTSLTRTAVTLTITASPAAPISGGDQTECAENPIQTLTATATVPAGQTIVWYDAATGGNVVANPILNAVGTVTYYAEATITATACLSLTRTAVTLTILNTPAAPISGGDQTECAQDPIQTLTATATVPGGQTIVWYDAATGGNVVANPILNTIGTVTYYAEAVITVGGCTSLTRTAVTLTITASPAAPISGGDQTECTEDPIQTLTATATVPAGQTIVWYDAATGGNVVANPILNTVGTVTYYAEASITATACLSLTRTAVTLTILNTPAAPISGGDQTECEEDPIQTLTATATVPGGQTIVWYDAATGGNVVANPILNTIGTITYYAEAVITVGGCTSLTRTAVTLTITASPNAPISGGDQTECTEDPIQTLTATATVPAGQTIVWYDAATGGNVVANPILNAVGTVTYYAEASITATACLSLTRTAVTLTILNTPAAPISGGDQTECEEDPIQTLTATATVPGGQTIVWYDAATGGNVVANPILNTIGTITYYAEAVVTIGGCISSTRTAVTLTITAAANAPISGGDQTECAEDPIQTLTATATVPGGQTIVWYDAATGGNVVANPVLNAIGTVTYYAEAIITASGCISLSRTAVTLTITVAPDAPISGGDQIECEENPIQTLTATATVPGGQTIVWYDAPTGGNVVANPILNTVGTITYYAEAVITAGGCVSLTRVAVTLTITAAPIAPITGGDQTECAQDPIQTLTATATVPGGQTIVWYDAPTGGNVVANPILNTVGTITYYAEAIITAGGCSSLTRTAVTLTITAAPDAPISGGDQTECEEDPIQTLTATATVPGGQTIVWYDAATGGNIVANPTLNTVGTITYYAEAVITAGGCISLTRTSVTLTITAAPDAPITGGDQSECVENPIQTLTATATVPGGQTIVWYDAPTGGNIVANPILNTVGTITYYAEANVTASGCVSLSRISVTLTLSAAPDAPISGGDQTECAETPIQTLTATATVPGGQTIIWYDALTGGNVVANPTLNSIGSITYYAEALDGSSSCISGGRTAVTLTLTDAPTLPISGGNQTECELDPIQTLTAIATVPGGQSVVWYDSAIGGSIVANPTLNVVGSVTYYAEAVVTIGGCTSSSRTAVVLTINSCSVSLSKSGVFDDNNGDTSSQAGETISYIFSLDNTSTSIFYNVVISDPLIVGAITGPVSGDDNNDNNLDPNEIWVFTATYVVTQADVDDGQVINQATVNVEDIVGNVISDLSDDPNNDDDFDANGDLEPDDPTITLLPGVAGVTFVIYNGVTPNGDNAHDYFQILGIEDFQNNSMQIFNRWGVIVFETVGYGGSSGDQNVFRGISEGRATVSGDKELPTGTYFYVLKFPGENPGKNTYSGYLYLNR